MALRYEFNIETGETTAHDDFVPPAPPTIDELRAEMPPITQRQLRLTIGETAVAAVDAALADDWAGMTEWQTASVFRRLHPLIVEMGPRLGLTPEQIDDLWSFALTIK
jgi:hypothetical protein